jgi:hypothetical protein
MPIKHLDTRTGREKYDVVYDMRYPLFEFDNIIGKSEKVNERFVANILESYEDLKLPVYQHRTMRGVHFISLVALHKDCYNAWIQPLMKYNPKCPMVTLRIRPNKWIGEDKVFFEGGIITNGAGDMAISQLEQFKTLVERQTLSVLRQKYYIVNYRMTGELGNL